MKPDVKRQGSKEPQTQSVQVVSQHHSGPLPSPALLREYDAVYPGLAKCIVTAFEAEYTSRQSLEKTALEADVEAMRLQSKNYRRGQIIGGLICLLGLGIGGTLVYLGHDISGATIASGGLASVITAYFRSDPPAGGPPNQKESAG